MMVASEKPQLSDSQERALIALVDLARSDSERGVHIAGERLWYRLSWVIDEALDVQGIRTPTASALERLGLIELRPAAAIATAWEARPTDAGVALCDSMGD